MSNGMLTIFFEGYFMCRLAVDPDPTNEERGMSGYTIALVNEDPLDQVIRYQADEAFMQRNARKPLREMGIEISVKVKTVLYNGAPFQYANRLIGAKVYLDGQDFPLPGVTFESRNSTVGSDDSFAFVVNPFNLRIQNDNVKITASDDVDPGNPARPLWQIDNPAIYSRRLPYCAGLNDTEAAEAIHVYDMYGYFRDRKRYLEKLIRDTQAVRAEESSATIREQLDAEIEGYKGRIYQLDHWGDRVINKLHARVGWQHDINGPRQLAGNLGGKVTPNQPWNVNYWFGGWDGDLLIGYSRGSLSVPFTFTGEAADSEESA